MRSFLANAGALLMAGVSLVLTVGLDTLLGLNLLSLMWWGVIPIGAFVMGLLAASGYYFGAVRLNAKPTRFVAVGLLIITGLVQVTLYYSQYARAMTAEGQPISSLVGFPRFVGWMLTHAKYGLVVYGYRPGGEGGGLEVGALGYVIATVQFLALVAGGLVVYFMLADKPYCQKCAKYLSSALKLQLPFAGDMELVKGLRQYEALSAQYFQALQALPTGRSAALELELTRCPQCPQEALTERPMLAKDGKLSYVGDAYRTMWSTDGSIEPQIRTLQSQP